ncbi:MAG: ABC transporter substrate-binding protein [Bacteroidia bacterium]
MKRSNTFLYTLLVVGLFLTIGCEQHPKEKFRVVIWELADPEMLNPVLTTDNNSDMVLKYMFQSLIEIDFKTLQLTPCLAESRPQIETTADGKVHLTFRIRKEANWDNGTPVTARDVEFTLKAVYNPAVNNPGVKSTLDNIGDIQLYPDDPKKLTITYNTVYFLAEIGAGGFQIIPEYAYDPKGLMKDYSMKELLTNANKYLQDPKIQEFATDMNSEKRMRDKNFICGSGAYELENWTSHQRLTLKKKKSYWGDALAEKVPYLAAGPDQLVFNTIGDMTAAVVALKAGNLDVIYSIKPKDFVELRKNPAVTEKFNIATPPMLSYTYIGMNTKSKLFNTKKTRQAFSHLADVDRYIETVYYGLAQKVIGPVHPSNRCYNKDITAYDFNIDKAKALLAEDGWKDSNGDGVLDKMIDGVHTEFKVKLTTNSESELRKSIALMFQEAARKAGIEVTVDAQEWSTFLSNLKKHNLDLFISAWVQTPVDNDLKQILHGVSAGPGGDNYASFTNNLNDSLIDAIRVELDDDKRAALYKKLQVVLHEEAPFIYLFSPTERMAFSKKFTNAEASSMRPGFNASQFRRAQQDK